VLVDLTLKELIDGKKTIIKYDWLTQWSQCKGTKAYDINEYVKWSNCDGTGYLPQKFNSPERICEKCHGTGGFSRSKCKVWANESLLKQVSREIYIPPGSLNIVTVPGYGHCSKAIQGQAGDLIIKINILESDEFKLDHFDIWTNREISISEAILGGKIVVNTLKGPRSIKLKRGTQNNDEIHIEKLGIPHDHGLGKLKIKFQVRIPSKISKDQEDLIRKFHKLEGIKEANEEYEELKGEYVENSPSKVKENKKKESMCIIF